MKILKSLKVKYFIAKNKGLAFQRALGIKKTKTKYVALIDADHRPTKKSFLLMLMDLKNSNYAAVQPSLIINKKNLNFFENSYQAITDINVNILGPKRMIGMPALWKTKIIKKNNFNPKITAGSDDTDLSYRLFKKGYVFGSSTAKIINIHRSTMIQYIKKYIWYGKGDAQFIIEHPERFLSILKHQIFNYPIKYSFILLSKGKFFPIFFSIMAGVLRFIGMMIELMRKILRLKEKIYST